jgi:hypothetical protein
MSESLTSRLAALKAGKELERKPFPLWALIILYNRARSRDVYCDYFYGFKLLRDWLGPIEIPEQEIPVPNLYRSYDIQEIAYHLGCTQGQINYGYQTALTVIQQLTDAAQLPKEIPTVSTELESNGE